MMNERKIILGLIFYMYNTNEKVVTGSLKCTETSNTNNLYLSSADVGC